MLEQIAKWKGLAASGIAALLVILQIVQIFLSSEIDSSLNTKISEIRGKTEAVNALLKTNGAISSGNAERTTAILKSLSDLEKELKQVEAEKTGSH